MIVGSCSVKTYCLIYYKDSKDKKNLKIISQTIYSHSHDGDIVQAVSEIAEFLKWCLCLK